jgi:soluble lytic murein transglycosylase-like protein
MTVEEDMMHTRTQDLVLRGVVILAGAVLVAAVAGWTRDAEGADPSAPLPRTALFAELRTLQRSLAAAEGEIALAQAQLARAEAVIRYSAGYGIPADVAAAVYDIALSEGLDPALAFRLVRVESGFNQQATSVAGAVGYTQILPSTARLYEPGLTLRQLYDRETNLRLGFRYLHDLLERFQGTTDTGLRLALLAYNRGPAKVQLLLDGGQDPRNGYEVAVMRGYEPLRAGGSSP